MTEQLQNLACSGAPNIEPPDAYELSGLLRSAKDRLHDAILQSIESTP